MQGAIQILPSSDDENVDELGCDEGATLVGMNIKGKINNNNWTTEEENE